MNRLYNNQLILDQLTKAVEAAPDLRFHQILLALGILKQHKNYSGLAYTEFYTEPEAIVARLTPIASSKAPSLPQESSEGGEQGSGSNSPQGAL